MTDVSNRLDRVELILDRLTANQETAGMECDYLRQSLANLTDLTSEFMTATLTMNTRLEASITRLDQNLIELRAGQERQERILDHLLQQNR